MTKLEEIKQRLEKATKGEWTYHYQSSDWGFPRPILIETDESDDEKTIIIDYGQVSSAFSNSRNNKLMESAEKDANFIVHSKQDIAWLLEQNQKLVEALKEIYADGSYEDIASEITEKALKEYEGGE